MKFTKTAVALAVASIAAAPMMASATTTLSGVVQIKLQGSDADGDAGDPTIAAGDVHLGLSHEHTMNNGLTAYGNYRLDVDGLSNAAADVGAESVKTLGSRDSVYVGMKGGFGDLRFGEIPLAVEYGQLSNDIFDVGGEISGGISYTNGFGPATIGLNWSPGQNSDVLGAGIKFNVGGFTIGLGAEDRNELMNMSAGVSFAYAGASIGAHFASKETGAADDEEIVGVKVGYGIGDVSLGVTFMQQTIGDADNTAARLDIGYDMGGNMNLSTRINSTDNDGADGSDWRIQLSKSF